MLPFEKTNGKSEFPIHTKMGKSYSERILTLLFIIKLPDDLKPLQLKLSRYGCQI